MGVCEQVAPAATLWLVGLADCPRASSVSTKRMAADSTGREAQAQCYQTDYQTGALREAALCLVPEARTQVRLLRPPIKPARALWVCAVLLPLLNYGTGGFEHEPRAQFIACGRASRGCRAV